MSRFIALAASAMLLSLTPVAPAMAHDGLAHLCHDAQNNPVDDINQCCYDPSTGGPTNVEGFPFCPAYLDRVAGGEQYGTVDRSALAHTHVCAPGVDCGPPVELSNVKPFYGSTGSPAPIPASVVVPQQAVAQQAVAQQVVAQQVVTTTTTTTAASALPAVYAPVTQLSTTGLGGGALIFGGLAAAGFAGLVALAASDDDDAAVVSSTSSGI